MLVLTLVVYAAERNRMLTSVRLALHNSLSPGRFLVASIAPLTSDADDAVGDDVKGSETATLQDALLQNELQRRRLVIENARLRNELQLMNRQQHTMQVIGDSLLRFPVLSAAVISEDGMSAELRELFINIGRQSGLTPSQLVVDGRGMLLDHGTDSGVTSDLRVISGLAVVGRVKSVSRWVSLVQPVSDPGFSAAVQLVQKGSNGTAFGARGMLEGLGDGQCRITGVAYTAAISVGDDVYTADIDGIKGPRLYFGSVVKAEFSAGGEWDILVEPAVTDRMLERVAIVQPQIRLAHGKTASSNASGRTVAGGVRP